MIFVLRESALEHFKIYHDQTILGKFQENYNTPLEHTQSAIPLPNYERIPFTAYW